MASRIALVIGAGSNIGANTLAAFRSKGFKVAQASRSAESDPNTDVLAIKGDLNRPETVKDIFDKVRATFGEPNVVIYNAAALHATKAPETFSVSLDDFEADWRVNTTSVFAAIKEATESFHSLPADVPKTFIYTGNSLNNGPIPGLLTLGIGKTASAHLIEAADQIYREQNSRFFYVDERNSDGSPMFTGLGGQAHADIFSSLADRNAGDVPWNVTFVSGKGYVEFPRKLILRGK